MKWNLIGDARQNAIAQEALDRCTFPFESFGEDRIIPVEWADLTRYAATSEPTVGAVMALGTGHGPPHDHGSHDHVHDRDKDLFDTMEYRRQVLGLAWYSGKVTLERTLVNDRNLAMEVFLSEGAHMLDFFGMTDDHRRAVWNAVHPPHERIVPERDIVEEGGVEVGHGHGWFDIGDYRSFVGEAWMGAFVQTYSDIPMSIPFAHSLQPGGMGLIRAAFGHELEQEEAPEPDAGDQPVFGVDRSAVYHDKHGGFEPDIVWSSAAEAAHAGRRPCRVCKPPAHEH